MGAELELLKTISGTLNTVVIKQDRHTDAISSLDKKLAVSNNQIENIHKMGCAPGAKKIKYVHERVDETHERINTMQTSGVASEQSNTKYTIIGTIIAAAVTAIILFVKYG